jgi:cyclopropane fatty-acyl-phospholipid synthase-like methyltransferase
MSDPYWDNQALTMDGAWHAVFSEPDVMTHTEQDVTRIVAMLRAHRHPSQRLPDGMLLDFGCGVGRLTASVAAAMGRKVHGFDPSPNMIQWAIESRLSDQVEFSSGGDAIDGTWPWAGAYSMLVFQHLSPGTVVDSLDAICSGLLPGGRFVFQFVVGDNHTDHDHRYAVNEMVGLTAAVGFGDIIVASDGRHAEWCWIVARKQ